MSTRCKNCVKTTELKYKYGKNNNSTIEAFSLEFCDDCFVTIYSNNLFKEMTSGNNLFRVLMFSLFGALIIAMAIILILYGIIIVNFELLNPSYLLTSLFFLFFGIWLVSIRFLLINVTKFRTNIKVRKKLSEINDLTKLIIQEKEIADRKKQEQIKKERERTEREKQEQIWREQQRQEQLRREQDRQERIRKAREKEYKIKNCGIEEIDKMDGIDFEKRLENLFVVLDYKVTVTPKSGDQGVDLILKKDSKKIAVQAKRYKGKVGNSAVQEILAGRTYYDCSEGWVVTTSYFTESAKNLASKVKIKLIDREELIKLLIQQQEKRA
ncbi:restriction endonuclease [Paenibacillus filicis]|uniref:Restriction endonuclease n=1 Tax=Paenibacillus gyeongsangnamensis TaxID=3388067 RepID=A0ABT4QBU1_9BACL|nr:restriction endonuclease [Paenibacillus filicis]MCZ8514352.1 restriction endonuclease [Paenibacillus filicis]